MNDGGSAFPQPSFPRPDCEIIWGDGGMTLRDYLAAKALSGQLANDDFMAATAKSCEGDRHHFARTVALTAFEIADAMLAEREKGTK